MVYRSWLYFISHMWLVIQYARIVREALCELEVPYILQNVGEGSSKMDLLQKISGSKQVKRVIWCILKSNKSEGAAIKLFEKFGDGDSDTHVTS